MVKIQLTPVSLIKKKNKTQKTQISQKENSTFDNGIFSTKAYLCNKYRLRSQSFTNTRQIEGKIANTKKKKNIFFTVSQKYEVNRKKHFSVGIFFSSDTEKDL